MTNIDRYQATWRMASSAAALARRNFLTLGIPAPEQVIYQPYGEKAPDSQGAMLVRGFAQVQLVWENMNQRQAAALRSAVQAGITAGYLYLTIDRGSAQAPGPDWVDIKGKPYLPDFAPIAKSMGQVYDRLALQILAVEVVNDPSSYAS